MHVFIVLLLSLGPMMRPVLARPAAGWARHTANNTNGRAIYLITNEKTNAVVAVPIGQDGLLGSRASCTATGGAGANGINGAKSQPAAPDALFSQASLTIAGNNLFAVNAGSNTLSMFEIDVRDPTKLSMVGKPAAIPGDFPNTVAASSKNKLACVATTGARAGISCASFSAHGLGPMDDLRPFDLGQATPPVGPTNTVSQVFFSDDGSTLFSTVKGDPPKNKTGFLAAFPVQAGACGGRSALGRQATTSSPAGTAVLFGSTTIPSSTDLFVTDASFGAAVLAVDAKGVATVKGKAAVAGQVATCWAAISPATDTAFVTDAGANRLVEMSLADAAVQGLIDLSANGDPGLIDLRAAGNFVYALSPGNGTTQAAVTVVDVVSKKQVQHFQLQGLGVGKNAQGLALSE